ncbi:10 kDa heat shock protein, mitochondrial-like [Psammomys obesus]|uniref:10 kDa heat shock protein, mitochondrial-like n=1 Tax=Psammomys obesus TaxID=48139 RepID=UPI002452FA50|nr:10 kDa heat shock protein, mitochondrial-like [Psammomys obesus]
MLRKSRGRSPLRGLPAAVAEVQSLELFRQVTAGQAFRKILLLFDRLLVERSATKTITKGIMLPEKSQGEVLQATVVAVRSGTKGKGGEIQPVSVKVGDKVLLPEYGGTNVLADDRDYFLFRDSDSPGKYVD